MSAYPQYHKTTTLNVGEYAERISQAAKQSDQVLAVYSRGKPMTPSEVHSILNRMGKLMPITSTRRAISGLERRGCLAKTGEQRRGPYDHLENCWQMTVEVAV
jgi:hypothetical protein